MRDQLKNMAAVNYDDINSEFVTVRGARGRSRGRSRIRRKKKMT